MIDYIKKHLRESLDMKKGGFWGLPITAHDSNGDAPDWQPLYKFLRGLFGDKYKEVANGFMWYMTIEYDGEPIEQYRHGISRTYFFLNSQGEPVDFDTKKLGPGEWEITGMRYVSNHEIFKEIFDKVKETLPGFFKANGLEMPEDIYTFSFAKYKSILGVRKTDMGQWLSDNFK